MATHSSVLAWRIPGTGRASWTAVSGVAQSQTQLKRLSSIEKEGFPGGSMGKEFACSAGDTGDTGSVPGLGRFPGGWHDSPLHYSCLENSIDRGAWWATVHRVPESQRSICQHPLDHRKKQKNSRKKIYFCFINYAKAFERVDHNKLWKILKEMAIPDHQNCLLRNLCAGQEAPLELDMKQQTGSK